MSEQKQEVHHVVMAKPSKNDFEVLWALHAALSEHEEAIEEVRNDADELNVWQEEFHEIACKLDKVLDRGSLGRVLMVCQSLVEQACNPDIDHVDFTDEIKAAVSAYRAKGSEVAA